MAAICLGLNVLTDHQVDPQEQTSVKYESKYIIFTWENAFVYVICKMVAILSRQHCVNWLNTSSLIGKSWLLNV